MWRSHKYTIRTLKVLPRRVICDLSIRRNKPNLSFYSGFLPWGGEYGTVLRSPDHWTDYDSSGSLSIQILITWVVWVTWVRPTWVHAGPHHRKKNGAILCGLYVRIRCLIFWTSCLALWPRYANSTLLITKPGWVWFSAFQLCDGF